MWRPGVSLVGFLLAGAPALALETATVWVNCGDASAPERAAYLAAGQAAGKRFFEVRQEDVVCRSLAPPEALAFDAHISMGRQLAEKAMASFGVNAPDAPRVGTPALLLIQLHRVNGHPAVRRGWIVVVRDGSAVGSTTVDLQPVELSEGKRLLVRSGLGVSAPELGISTTRIPTLTFNVSPSARIYGDAAIEVPPAFE